MSGLMLVITACTKRPIYTLQKLYPLAGQKENKPQYFSFLYILPIVLTSCTFKHFEFDLWWINLLPVVLFPFY